MLAAEAERRILNMTETMYGHSFPWKHTTVYFEEFVDKGVYKYDCCGFVARVLDYVCPKRREQLFEKLKMRPGYVPSPKAYTWFFQSIQYDTSLQEHWSQITCIGDIVRGSILGWAPNMIEGNGSRGHVIIALNAPEPWTEDDLSCASTPNEDNSTKTSPEINKSPQTPTSTRIWHKLKIADSTTKLHTNDSRTTDDRAKPNGEFKKGGQGTGFLLVSEANKFLWVRWGACKTSTHAYGPVYGANVLEYS